MCFGVRHLQGCVIDLIALLAIRLQAAPPAAQRMPQSGWLLPEMRAEVEWACSPKQL
jgi:hypothetical protein